LGEADRDHPPGVFAEALIFKQLAHSAISPVQQCAPSAGVAPPCFLRNAGYLWMTIPAAVETPHLTISLSAR
jgi:hypothetical protein